MRQKSAVRERLASGQARGLGAADAVAQDALRDPATLKELVAALQDERALVQARAANALKRVQARRAELIAPFAKELLRAALKSDVLKAQWNLTIVVGGLELRGRERSLAVELLFEGLRSGSSLLRTFAMQGLVNFAAADAGLRKRVRPVVEEFAATGTAAMRARARRLLPLVAPVSGWADC